MTEVVDISDNSEEYPEDTTEQEASGEAFDYEAADYSLFQKAKNKVAKMQKIREKFKGKVCVWIVKVSIVILLHHFITHHIPTVLFSLVFFHV